MQIVRLPALNDLVRLLSDLYEVEDIRRIVDLIPLDRGRLNLQGKPLNIWHGIVDEANKQGLIPRLLEIAKADYPTIDFSSLAAQLGSATVVQGPEPGDWRGDPSDKGTLERITGDRSTFLPISFLEIGLDKARSVGRLETKSQKPIATCFLVASNLLMTNNHAIGTIEGAREMQVRFNYQKNSCDEDVPHEIVDLDPAKFFSTSAVNDWTIVATADDPGAKWGWIKLEDKRINTDDFVNIVQHPEGQHKKIAIYHNIVQYADANRVQYLTDTRPGSSGSPVFDSDWNLVALHHSGGLILEPGTEKRFFRNEGIAMPAILKDIKKYGF